MEPGHVLGWDRSLGGTVGLEESLRVGRDSSTGAWEGVRVWRCIAIMSFTASKKVIHFDTFSCS